ncbi:MAG: alpha-amylase family glycosyl hydrolase [Blautia hansenii]
MRGEKRIETAPGNMWTKGVEKQKDGFIFTLEAEKDAEASLLLYTKEGVLEIPFLQEGRKGNLLSMAVKGICQQPLKYNYKIDGEVTQDDYAKILYHTASFGEVDENICCGYLEGEFSWSDEEFTPIELCNSVLYKLQVRSFTKSKTSKVRHKGTFQGVQEKLEYLKDLGITGVLLMPAYEYREIQKPRIRGKAGEHPAEEAAADKRVNCWGYTEDACYFAPKAAFCATQNPAKEFADMVNAFHEAGLECMMEFYFGKHTALTKMLDVLRYWKITYHIDGFHIMGEGISQELFMKDPLLADCKLFFHDIDGSCVFHGKVPKFKNAAEYNEGFLYSMRHVLKGDENMTEEFMFRQKRNPLCNGVINYMADQDGFTVMDMVSYEERHNEANGEGNQDGISYNCSWNCGAEGSTRKTSIKELRLKQMKNAFSLLLFSQGTPLIFQGDEWGNTQKGNNNVWCQDNELSWIDWNGRKNQEKLWEFVKRAIQIRKENPILHWEKELKGSDYQALGYPDMSYHGKQAWYVEKDKDTRSLGIMYCNEYAGKASEFLFLAFNFHWIEHEIALPGAENEIKWQVLLSTETEKEEKISEGTEVTGKTIEVPPRTVMILAGKQEQDVCGFGSILKRLQGTSF